MRNLLLLILITFFALPLLGNTSKDKEELLKKSIEPEVIRQHLAMHFDTHIFILQHGVSFPTDLQMQIAEQQIQLVDKEFLSQNNQTPYLLFWTFNQDNTSAFIEYTIVFNDTESLKVSVSFKNEQNEWVVEQIKSQKLSL